MKHVDHSSLEPAEGYHVHERMSAIEMQKGQNDPEFIRYKRYFFEARQAELIEETKKVAPLKHPHLIRLIGIVKMREEKTKQGKIVRKLKVFEKSFVCYLVYNPTKVFDSPQLKWWSTT